jgi:hypothetical protein
MIDLPARSAPADADTVKTGADTTAHTNPAGPDAGADFHT